MLSTICQALTLALVHQKIQVYRHNIPLAGESADIFVTIRKFASQ